MMLLRSVAAFEPSCMGTNCMTALKEYFGACVSAMLMLSVPAIAIFASEPTGKSPLSPSAETGATEALVLSGPNQSEFPDLDNLLQVSDRIFTGAEPHSERAFASLAKLGVKTIVSVDGAVPDTELAGKYGLRYVHIPIGYDGIDQNAGLTFARLAREVTGPVYVHCHHGRHRGPAAAAVVCIASGEVDGEAALRILERAGTSKDYAGLWRDVANYRIPDHGVELPTLSEVAQVQTFPAAMANTDRAYDNLKRCRESGWATPPDHPDLVPAQQALLLKESLRESVRNLAAGRSSEFQRWLMESEIAAGQLEDALRVQNLDQVSRHFQVLSESCKRCHQKYRN
ncbi:Predicted phosphohydrolase, protein tyrosine phosphatase (PTP) superfamily, DUF442 family [Neorhodopirellula lusitana]|uniref:Predicted phosphohydrolase, protein tyrosine phosphatase (PTP) superfamily, DUF442 family n=2 Tax=Neorhodopirellula lusitana TaxID=445327 RepID=A0ABY1Q023_9BACT|nr:Predicted phosphohydrolase, protein tyrosine phosphatase (PTP) superfamily, DUF442 family [Neorhodopirellula lusitana]